MYRRDTRERIGIVKMKVAWWSNGGYIDSFRGVKKMQSVKLCVYLGSGLLVCYLMYFSLFAYQIFAKLQKFRRPDGARDDDDSYYRDASVFELKHEASKTPGKDMFISLHNISDQQPFRAFNPAIQLFRDQLYFVVRSRRF